jgi:hypothetical protein
MTRAADAMGRRGMPLIMLLLVLGAWTGTRAMWWENPFPAIAEVVGTSLAEAVAPTPPRPAAMASPSSSERAANRLTLAMSAPDIGRNGLRLAIPPSVPGVNPQKAAAHHLLWYAAMHQPSQRDAIAEASYAAPLQAARDDNAPFLPSRSQPQRAAGRWSLDAWAFWRQGSNAAQVSVGRVPIYGASQAGAVLQYRLAPAARRDPRLYARAYRALVRQGESEVALGASARPMGRVPLRLAGEVRVTDSAFGTAVRPAAFAVTELAPLALPLETQLEAYVQAGWVGGAGATGFADGQASLTREVEQVAASTANAARLRIGAAAWGGAQEGAQRIDIGPTMRIDLTLGTVPARLSLDWRERVGGTAGPESGLAATLSTRF